MSQGSALVPLQDDSPNLQSLVPRRDFQASRHYRNPLLKWKTGLAASVMGAMLFTFAPVGAQEHGAGSSATKSPTEKAAPKTLRDSAWSMLTDAVVSTKVRTRSDAVSALSILDTDPRALRLLENELEDKEEEIQVLAATSLGNMKARSAIPKLKKAMDDPSPVVDFAAAQALWKMGDRSGRDMLYQVLIGERKASDGIVKTHIQQVKKDLRDPKTMALIGLNQASGAFLGPFAMGVSFAEEYAKNKSAPVQAICANLLAVDDTSDTVEQLAGALADDNWMVRAAAAKALAKMHRTELVPALKEMVETDKSEPARLMAAAAVVKLTEGGPARVAPHHAPDVKAAPAAGLKATTDWGAA